MQHTTCSVSFFTLLSSLQNGQVITTYTYGDAISKLFLSNFKRNFSPSSQSGTRLNLSQCGHWIIPQVGFTVKTDKQFQHTIDFSGWELGPLLFNKFSSLSFKSSLLYKYA